MINYNDYFATTAPGFENLMNSELNNIGIKNCLIRDAVIYFKADHKQAVEFLYTSTVCNNISLIICRTKVLDYDELYQTAKTKIEWEKYFSVDKSFMIHSTIMASPLKHSGFAALKLKDSIADYFREKFNCRPNVDKISPDIIIELRIFKTNMVVGINLAGMPLFKRGYRTQTNAAPMKETLAAGIAGIILNNSKNSIYKKIIDPMCGSGTIIIETAFQILKIPAQRFNTKLSFNKFNFNLNQIFSEIKEKKETGKNFSTDIRFYASDHSQSFIDSAKKNIENAGLSNLIQLSKQDFFNPVFDMENSIIIFNPPHGERMQGAHSLEFFYGKIGDTIKKFCKNSAVYIFCPAEENLISKIGIIPDSKLKLYNGKIICNLIEFRL
ncbi:hypothetical protein KA977_00885 [Candidatus Dependentiae bacterium]|nr:hypothetical protein [Candidatus Dependentiae bacterium]